MAEHDLHSEVCASRSSLHGPSLGAWLDVSVCVRTQFVSASERQFVSASERQFCQCVRAPILYRCVRAPICECDVCAEAPLPQRRACDRAPAKMPSAYANGCVRAPFVFIGFLCPLMYPGSAEAVLRIRGSVGGPGRGVGGRRGLVPRLVQSGSRVALLPPIPTITPSAAPLCVVPLSIPPLVVSGVALRLWLPLVAFVPLLRGCLMCSLVVHLQPFVNVVG